MTEMNKPPLGWPLKAVLLICAIVFFSSATFALTSLPASLAILQMAPAEEVDFLDMVILTAPFILPLYCSHTFARILVRRSVLNAKIFLVVMLTAHACALWLGWEAIRGEGWQGIAGILGSIALLASLLLLLVRPQARAMGPCQSRA